MSTSVLVPVLLLALAAPAAAQNEAALKSYFEGTRVTLRMDMPGDADGVDVHADARQAVDFGRYKPSRTRARRPARPARAREPAHPGRARTGVGDEAGAHRRGAAQRRIAIQHPLRGPGSGRDAAGGRDGRAGRIRGLRRPAVGRASGGSGGVIGMVRKGLSRAEAERLFGPPASSSERREGGLTVTTLVFDMEDQRVTADFVDDVLIRYIITSR